MVLVRAAGAGLVHVVGVDLDQQGPHVVELSPLGHLVAARYRMGNLLLFYVANYLKYKSLKN